MLHHLMYGLNHALNVNNTCTFIQKGLIYSTRGKIFCTLALQALKARKRTIDIRLPRHTACVKMATDLQPVRRRPILTQTG